MAPRGLPADIVSRLSEALRVGLESTDVKFKMDAMSLGMNWSTPDSYRELIRRNLKKYEQAIKISKIRPE